MAAPTPAGSISLRGAPDVEDAKAGHSCALLLKLDQEVVQDLRKASREKEGLRFTAGSTPKLRIGNRSIDLTLSTEDFRNELYASTAAQSRDFEFLCTVSHRAEIQKPNRTFGGTDAALAESQLLNKMALEKQQKQANQTTITKAFIDPSKNRAEAARKEKFGRKNTPLSSQGVSPSLGTIGTPQAGQAPTSAPASEAEVRLKAMRTPIVHLLAIQPTTIESILNKTHVPQTDLEEILHKSGKKVEGKWQLTDRGYKELDVWDFNYPSQQDRQSAVDNAVRAYDRMRLGKEDKLWQMLLPEKERGKGRVLSRLHLGGGPVNRGLTPSYQPSPAPHVDAVNDSRVTSAANTPRLGATTPRPSSSKGDVMKRLLSKDPKRAQAAEQAKEKKRKEREAAASDREGRPAKKQATQEAATNVKSAEFVRSSDDDSGEEGEITSQPRITKDRPTTKRAKPPTATKDSSPDSSDVATKPKVAKKPTTHGNTTAATTKKVDSPSVKATKPAAAGRATPQTNGNLSAPNTQHKSQRSPQKQDSRPNVPSPLGAARPRVASDVSDRGAVGVQKVKQSGADTPKGLGISNGNGKHPTKTTKPSQSSPEKAEPDKPKAKEQKSTMNGAAVKPDVTNGIVKQHEGSAKRKAEDSPSQGQPGAPAAKHQKKDSGSSQSQKSNADGSPDNNETPRPSPDAIFEGDKGDVAENLTYAHGVQLAERFLYEFYPKYSKLYDKLSAAEAQGETVSKEDRDLLLAMDARLRQMKREIEIASTKEEKKEEE
ncbi:uncharacterized protein LTR77_010464 [Saxophila tyrrhenica]|uniref:E3 ubiquitin-protein ligase n=1 Tax=Saxophila tyrrhenica TaxID=1690608 RepID=A0AAV9NVH7_9PEZI|nr:hypothetical protein LTR77_010464 [Saxophila tyrrhenica]